MVGLVIRANKMQIVGAIGDRYKSWKCLCGTGVGNVCLENTDCCGDTNLCMHVDDDMKFNCCFDPNRKSSIKKASTQYRCFKFFYLCDYDCECCAGLCTIYGVCD